MNILVTGANGMIGGEVVRSAIARGHRVIAVGRGPCRIPNTGLTYRSVDLTDLDGLHRTALTSGAGAVVHCGAMTDVDLCERQPMDAWYANFEATRVLAQAASFRGARFVYISTESVFSGADGPYHEADVPDPINVYSRTKLAGEYVVKDYCKDHALVRVGSVYGGRMGGKPTFADRVVENLRAGVKVRAFRDQSCSTTLASAAGDRILAILESGWQGSIHASDRDVCTRDEFAMAIAHEFSLDKSLIEPCYMYEADMAALRPTLGGLKTGICHEQFPNNRPLPLREALHRYRLEKDGT